MSTHPNNRSLALRLTAWYAAIFAASSLLAFALVFAAISSLLAERTDEELRSDFDEYAAHWRHEGLDRVKAEMRLDTQGEDARKTYFRLWNGDGRPLATTDLGAWPEAAALAERRLPSPDLPPVFETHEPASQEAPVRTLVGAIAPGVFLEIGLSIEDNEDLREDILHAFVLSLVGVLLLGAPIGWFLARQALRGVREVTRTAREIADGALDRRVPVSGRGDELDQLARTFNTMLDRVQALITGMRDMADNLAHDLRSPIGRIRAAAEMSLSSGDAAPTREMLAVDTIEECDRLLEMLNTTLDIAEADAGAAQLKLERLDLTELVQVACELFQTPAEDRRITLTAQTPASCWIAGDRQRLQRVVANLLDNALKYTPEGGAVRVVLNERAEGVTLTVADSGIGIAAADLPRIFQRFYRGDPSRSTPGIGLGLSLALAFVRAHGGDLTVASTHGRGSEFAVVLPHIAERQSARHLLLRSAA